MTLGGAVERSPRYGDYFEIADDPSKPGTFWVAGEFNPSSPFKVEYWSTFIGKFTTTMPLSPLSTNKVLTTATPFSITTSAGKCEASLWDHVYHKPRLMIRDPCITATGIVEKVTSAADGDYHINVALDPQYAGLVNSVNDAQQNGTLVVEAVCQHTTREVAPSQACQGYPSQFHFDKPTIGARIEVTGPYVTDTHHGWNEIQPINNIAILSEEFVSPNRGLAAVSNNNPLHIPNIVSPDD